MTLRKCIRERIPEIADAARYLNAAVSAHLNRRPDLAEQLIQLADIPAIREWTESIWGRGSPYLQITLEPHGAMAQSGAQATERMPSKADKQLLLIRDGFHCRFCGIPVIRAEVRQRIAKAYPNALSWGRRNVEQHAAFQAMWTQYDHVLPHSKGGAVKSRPTVTPFSRPIPTPSG